MRRFDRWTSRVGVVAALLALMLQVGTVVAQPPAKAPVVADDGAEPVRVRARKVISPQAQMMRQASGTSVVVEGEHVYLVYGGYLIQFSVDGLKLEAKINLRDLLKPDAAARKAAQDDRRARGDKPRVGRDGLPAVDDAVAPVEQPDADAAPDDDADQP